MHKILLFVATEKGYKVLLEVIKSNKDIIGLVTSFEETNTYENYYNDIETLCRQNNLRFISWQRLKQDFVDTIRELRISEAIAIGWRYLIPLEVNNYLTNELIVFHDSLLPRFRGFSPTPTAILCGENEIGMSVIFAGKEMDKGPIILQKKALISSDTYIKEAIAIQSELYCEAVKELVYLIENDGITSFPQDEERATYSIWRNPEDCQIDWESDSTEIYNLVRAVGYPYTGAFTYMENMKIHIWRAEVINDVKFEKRDCGKVWSIDEDGNATIICGKGMLKLIDITDEKMNKIQIKNIRRRLYYKQ